MLVSEKHMLRSGLGCVWSTCNSTSLSDVDSQLMFQSVWQCIRGR